MRSAHRADALSWQSLPNQDAMGSAGQTAPGDRRVGEAQGLRSEASPKQSLSRTENPLTGRPEGRLLQPIAWEPAPSLRPWASRAGATLPSTPTTLPSPLQPPAPKRTFLLGVDSTATVCISCSRGFRLYFFRARTHKLPSRVLGQIREPQARVVVCAKRPGGRIGDERRR